MTLSKAQVEAVEWFATQKGLSVEASPQEIPRRISVSTLHALAHKKGVLRRERSGDLVTYALVEAL